MHTRLMQQRLMDTKLIAVLAVFLLKSIPSHGQISTTVCDILEGPAAFDGKLVQIRALRLVEFEVDALVDPEGNCSGKIWLDSDLEGTGRHGTRGAAGRAVKGALREAFKGGMAATLTGYIAYAGEGSFLGFGHMNSYRIQFTPQSVTDPEVVRGFLAGRVIDPDGKAVANAEVRAKDARKEEFPPTLSASMGVTACTDDQGQFTLSVLPGRYNVGINWDSPATPVAPFPTTYFPGTTQIDSAKTVTIRDKEHEDLTIPLGNPLPQRVVPLKVVWPDGSPAAGAALWAAEVTDSPLSGWLRRGWTENAGTIDVTLLQDSEYSVHALTKAGNQLYCAKMTFGRNDEPNERMVLKLEKNAHDACSQQTIEESALSISDQCWPKRDRH